MLTDFQILHHGPGQEDAAWPYECQLYFGREIEKDAREEAAQVMRRALQALDGPSHSWEENQAEAERILGAWLAEKPQEAPHATPA